MPGPMIWSHGSQFSFNSCDCNGTLQLDLGYFVDMFAEKVEHLNAAFLWPLFSLIWKSLQPEIMLFLILFQFRDFTPERNWTVQADTELPAYSIASHTFPGMTFHLLLATFDFLTIAHSLSLILLTGRMSLLSCSMNTINPVNRLPEEGELSSMVLFNFEMYLTLMLPKNLNTSHHGTHWASETRTMTLMVSIPWSFYLSIGIFWPSSWHVGHNNDISPPADLPSWETLHISIDRSKPNSGDDQCDKTNFQQIQSHFQGNDNPVN